MRKDKKKMAKILGKYRWINMREIYPEEREIIWRYIEIMRACFAVGLFDEGFSLLKLINSMPTNSSSLSLVKSIIPQD